MKISEEIEGRAVFYNGKFWGQVYADGHSSADGWVGPKKANISTYWAGFCGLKEPTDLTYENSPYTEELKKGKVVNVRKTTTIEILEDE